MYMGVSENRGTPKSSILIRFSTINHPFWGTPILETPIYTLPKFIIAPEKRWLEDYFPFGMVYFQWLC